MALFFVGAVAFAFRPGSGKQSRRGRPHSSEGRLIMSDEHIDEVVGHLHHRPRVGWHQGAQQPTSALVGHDVLRHHRLGDRLHHRLSGMADADVGDQGRARLFEPRRRQQRACRGRSRQGEVCRRRSIENGRSEIAGRRRLREFAVAAGSAAYKVNCVQCHGSGAQGSQGLSQPQ